MADNRPAYVQKDCTLFVDKHARIGQCSEITVPVLQETVETMRNAGMVKGREIMMGYEATTASFKETALDPKMLKLYGLGPGSATPIIAYAYLEDEDGLEHTVRCEMECRIKTIDMGAWAPGQKAETQYDLANHAGRLFIDDEEIFAWSDLEVSVAGQVRQPGRRTALRIG